MGLKYHARSATRREENDCKGEIGNSVIIDDDSSCRQHAGDVLEAKGYQTEVFESGEAFLDSCGSDRRGCILVDFQMPGMTGIELQGALRGRRIYNPLILMSASAGLAVASMAFRGGAIDVIGKPLNDEVLTARVEEAMIADEHRALDRCRRLNPGSPGGGVDPARTGGV